MDEIDKEIKKLSSKEKENLKSILKSLKSWPWKGLNVQKLKGTDKIFRVKKGRLRVIFRLESQGNIYLLKVERRSDDTYKDF